MKTALLCLLLAGPAFCLEYGGPSGGGALGAADDFTIDDITADDISADLITGTTISATQTMLVGTTTAIGAVSSLIQSQGATATELIVQNSNTGFTITDGLSVGISATGAGSILLLDNGNLQFGTAGNDSRFGITPTLFWLLGGNVGVGLSVPARKFHISGTAAAVDLAITDTATGETSTDGFQIQMRSGSLTTYLYNFEPYAIEFGTNGSPRMNIAADGSIGIGTVNSTSTLDMGGTLGLWSRSSAELGALPPGRAGEAVYNSDLACMCVSTGTGTGAWVTSYKDLTGAVVNCD